LILALVLAVKKSSLFRFDEDDDDNDNAIKKANKEIIGGRFKVKNTLSSNDESSVYDYDGEYDSFKKERESQLLSQSRLSSASSSQPTARYIDSLKASAKVREREKDRVYEKQLLKEREEEEKEFGDKPKFLTSAYKAKLEEEKKWEYEDRLAEEIEKRQDVKQKGMQGFYSNLLTKNIAMGSDVTDNAISAYTAGSSRQRHLVDEKQDSDLQQEQSYRTNSDKPKLSHIAVAESSTSDVRIDSNVVDDQNDQSHSSSHGREDSGEVVVAKKDDKILSARERYLARKRSVAEVNDRSTD
jgi:coiled-coil domain-containing protein 55